MQDTPTATAGPDWAVEGETTRHVGGASEFLLQDLLAIQCQVVPAAASAMLASGPQGRFRAVAVQTTSLTYKASRDWIERAAILAEQASAENRRVIGKLPREATSGEVRDEEFLLLVPVPRANDDEQHGRVVACVIKAHDEAAIQVQQTRLELCLGLLSLNHLRRGLTQTEGNLTRLKEIMGAVGAVGESSRFKTSTMNLCNELAARWRCDRVSVGFVRQNHGRLETIRSKD